MPAWKPGDRVKIADKQPSMEDRLGNKYFPHMAGLTGTVQAVYSKDEVAVKIDKEAFGPVLAAVHKEAVTRMRAKFIDSLGEEQKKRLSDEEKKFDANYVLLVRSDDLEKGPKPPPSKKSKQDEPDPETYEGTRVRTDVVYDDQSVPDAPRRSLLDYEAAEEKELRKRRK
jgi:hypothetical protein